MPQVSVRISGRDDSFIHLDNLHRVPLHCSRVKARSISHGVAAAQRCNEAASRGYRILPVNPTLIGRALFGMEVAATLADLAEPADVIEVFRRPEFLPGHAREILSLSWRPAVVWFQLGIRHDGAAEMLARAGILVVQDRCMMPEHRRLLGAA